MGVIWRAFKGECVQDGDCSREEYTRTIFGPAIEVCSFCGGRAASGWWRGHKSVTACKSCALTVLPALLADSMVGELGHHPDAMAWLARDLVAVLAAFWRAAAIAVSRCCRRALAHERQAQRSLCLEAREGPPLGNGHAGRVARS